MKKRILAIILSVFLFVTVCPFAAFAGDADVAQIGSTNYDSLAAAIAAVPTDGTETTIKMIANETINGNAGVTIAAGQKIILDLNGYTISNLVTENKASQVITNYGTLTIADSTDMNKDGTGKGKITNSVTTETLAGSWPSNNYTTNIIDNNGIFTIESGTLINIANGSICYAIDNFGFDGYSITCKINGGLIKNEYCAPIRIGPTNSKSVIFEMTDGVVEGKYGIVFNCSKEPMAEINIMGGEVKATSYAFYLSSACEITDPSNVKIAFAGGTFGNGAVPSDEDLIDIPALGKFIVGGTYTEDPSAYVPDNFKVIESEGLFTVVLDEYIPAIGIILPTDVDDATQKVVDDILESANSIAIETTDKDTKLEDVVDMSALTEVAIEEDVGNVIVDTYISVKLNKVVAGDGKIPEITFEIVPMAKVYDTESGTIDDMVIPNNVIDDSVTLRLPLPESFKGMKVRVLHDGKFLCDTEVITDDLGTYIEFEANSFSPYTVTEIPEEEPTPTPPASKPENKPATNDASLEKIADTVDGSQALGSVAFCVASILSIAAIEKRKRED